MAFPKKTAKKTEKKIEKSSAPLPEVKKPAAIAAQELPPMPQTLEAVDLPQPEDCKTVEAPSVAGTLTVEPIGVGVGEVGIPSNPAVDQAEALVSIRALKSVDMPPNIGDFSFQNTVGRSAMNGRPVRGQYLKDHIYMVPQYVADCLVEKNWALRTNG